MPAGVSLQRRGVLEAGWFSYRRVDSAVASSRFGFFFITTTKFANIPINEPISNYY